MALEQAYYFSVALVNLVFAFAGTQIKELDNRSNSIHFFIISFFAYFISWVIYVFEVGKKLEITSALAATIFVWTLVLFSFKRASIKVPWAIIAALFLTNCLAQVYVILKGDFTYYLHVSAIFVPSAFFAISYMFLKVKKDRYPSDKIVGYACAAMALVIIGRSVLLEFFPDLFAQSSMYSQIAWPAFCSIIGVYALLSYTEEAQQKFEHDSYTDQLTGIYNRRMFDSKLKGILQSTQKNGQFGGLIYLDLDGFKPINDKFGHYVGDKVLIELAARIETLCPADGIVARLGGDEFACIHQNIADSLEEAQAKALHHAEKIQTSFDIPIKTQGLSVQVGCSIGIHILTPNYQNAHIALREADNAMYQSKRNKRGGISFSEQVNQLNYGLGKVEVSEIDQEHEEIDILFSTLLNDRSNIEENLLRLKTALEEHFATEVRLSKELGLKMTPEHQKDHKQILTLIREYQWSGDSESAHNFMNHVYKLLRKHSADHDLKMNQKH